MSGRAGCFARCLGSPVEVVRRVLDFGRGYVGNLAEADVRPLDRRTEAAREPPGEAPISGHSVRADFPGRPTRREFRSFLSAG